MRNSHYHHTCQRQITLSDVGVLSVVGLVALGILLPNKALAASETILPYFSTPKNGAVAPIPKCKSECKTKIGKGVQITILDGFDIKRIDNAKQVIDISNNEDNEAQQGDETAPTAIPSDDPSPLDASLNGLQSLGDWSVVVIKILDKDVSFNPKVDYALSSPDVASQLMFRNARLKDLKTLKFRVVRTSGTADLWGTYNLGLMVNTAGGHRVAVIIDPKIKNGGYNLVSRVAKQR